MGVFVLVRVCAELETLQEEFSAQEDFIDVVNACSFGFLEGPEDADNMSVEILSEVSPSSSSRTPTIMLVSCLLLSAYDSNNFAFTLDSFCPVLPQMLRSEGRDNEEMISACKVTFARGVCMHVCA